MRELFIFMYYLFESKKQVFGLRFVFNAINSLVNPAPAAVSTTSAADCERCFNHLIRKIENMEYSVTPASLPLPSAELPPIWLTLHSVLISPTANLTFFLPPNSKRVLE